RIGLPPGDSLRQCAVDELRQPLPDVRRMEEETEPGFDSDLSGARSVASSRLVSSVQPLQSLRIVGLPITLHHCGLVEGADQNPVSWRNVGKLVLVELVGVNRDKDCQRL